MLKKEVKYKDFDGNDVSEILYFNLTKAELIEMEMTTDEGYGEKLKSIVASEKPKDMFDVFKKIILEAYGTRSADGKRFIKSPEQSLEFTQTLAYDALIMELVTDDKFASEFVRGIVPMDIIPEVDKEIQELMKERGVTPDQVREQAGLPSGSTTPPATE